MADELTKEQLEDYKEAFTLFNQVIESLILLPLLAIVMNMYFSYGNVTEYEFFFLTGRNNYHISAGNNHALIRLQPIARRA